MKSLSVPQIRRLMAEPVMKKNASTNPNPRTEGEEPLDSDEDAMDVDQVRGRPTREQVRSDGPNPGYGEEDATQERKADGK